MQLKDLPPAARPRERALALGVSSLADAELLALLLRTGVRGRGVLQFAHDLLQQFGGFSGLLQADTQALGRVRGLGPARRAELAAVAEMARRSLQHALSQAPVFDTPERVRQFLLLHMSALPHEEFAVLFLDAQHRLIEMKTLFRGTLSQTSVYPREVVREALTLHAGAVVLAHNHPSGAAEPSRADELLTQTLKSALQLVDIRVLDHLVVGRGQVVSFCERGLL
jgi:DNA repair protein RadC